MGKAKRLRQLRNKFALSPTPNCFEIVKTDFLNKQIDLEIIPVSDCRISAPQLAKDHLVLPIPSQHNDARDLFVQHQQQIMRPMAPLLRKYGKGWIIQKHDYQTNYTYWGYTRATRASLKRLSCEILSGNLGQTVGYVIEYTLSSWSFEPSHQLIPVFAISHINSDSSWLYCI